MISDSCLTREYLEAKRVELGCDQILLEKTIKALQLLELRKTQQSPGCH
ncbi:hypothetical protein [Mesotoga sp. B105.6.4]|jgi:hypothetical protein|nr:hypothetical protein [Mesotoga sp. B105.6.4]